MRSPQRVLLALASFAALSQVGFCQTIWTAGMGDWNNPSNWTLGVPNSSSGTTFDAIVQNGGTAQLSATGASVRRLRIGLVGGPGALVINNGGLTVTQNLHLNEGSSGPATVTVQGSSTVTSPETDVGYSSNSPTTFNITGSAQYTSTGDFTVGLSGAGLATLSLTNGGQLTSVTSTIGSASGAIGTATVDGAGTAWKDSGAFAVGSGGVGTLTIQNQGTVSTDTSFSIASTSTVNLNGGTLRFNTISGLNRLVYTSGTIQLVGARNVSFDSVVTGIFGNTPTIPAGKALNVEGTATVGSTLSGTTIVNGGQLTASTYQIGQSAPGNLQVLNGGTLIGTGTNGFEIGGTSSSGTGSATFSGVGTTATLQSGLGVGFMGSGTLMISGGAVVNSFSGLVGSFASGVSGSVTITGAGSAWIMAESPINVGAVGGGTVNVLNQGLLYVGTDLFMSANGVLNLDGGTLRFDTLTDGNHPITYTSGTIQLSGDRGVGTDAIISRFYGTTPTMVPGKGLAVEGTATLTKTLSIVGGSFRATNIVIGAEGALDFDRGVLELTGGTITGISSLAVPTNGEFRTRGSQILRIAGAAGSTITATGNLTIGDATAVNGFYTDGTLNVGSNAVTLSDANDAAFDTGALVLLGSGANAGKLDSANGLTIDFGGNVTGVGTITAPNNIAKPLINNGHIAGTSATQRITLSGYTKGVGTFDNVTFSGTFSPGLSPAIVQTSNMALGSSSTLVMELGGVAAGSGYDQIQDSAQLTLGGTLQLALINGFSPVAGNSFDLLNWSTLSGTFTTLNLPALASGLAWNTSQLYSTGVVSVTAAAGVAGDYNNNGVVDAADYVVWRANQGTSHALPNDPTGGVIGAAQYATWRSHFGQTAGSGAGTSLTTVPEPSSSALMFLVSWSTVVVRRRAAHRKNSDDS